MTRRRKKLLRIFGGLIGFLLVVVVTAIFVVQSRWFYDRVRDRIVTAVETATGGRVEIRAFRFDWQRLRAEIDTLVLHGTEPVEGPPLFRADSVAVGLKIISILKQNVDIAYLNVDAPRVYLIIGADGRTNVPEPKIKKKAGKPALETILDLAIGRFSLANGQFEIASRSKTPFSAKGDHLNARFLYDLTGPRYKGNLSIQPVDLVLGDIHPLPLGIDTALTIEANRIGIDSAKLTTGASTVQLAGAIENLSAPHGKFGFSASVSVPEATPILKIPELHHGRVELKGNADWAGGSEFTVTSTLHGTGIAFRDNTIRLEGFTLDGAVTANSKGLDASGLRLGGNYVTDIGTAPVVGNIRAVALRHKDLQIDGVALQVFGGTFNGSTTILNLKRFDVQGSIQGILARPVVAMYSPSHLPWNAIASGPVAVQGEFKNGPALHAFASLNVEPAADSAPVHGQITANYLARDKTLDLGHSKVALPSSNVEFSGVLGRQLQVHLDTRELDDLLPAIGESAAHVAVKLTGLLVFDGTVTGAIEQPQIAGHTRVTGYSYLGQHFESFDAPDTRVSPAGVRLRNAVVVQNPMRAQVESFTLAMDNWKTGGDSAVTASGSVRGGTVVGLGGLLELKDLPLAGNVAGTGQVTGTLDDIRVASDFQMTNGLVRREPFDRFTGHLNYTTSTLELLNGQASAGDGQAMVSAFYRHELGHFDTGHLNLRLNTNARSLVGIQTVQEFLPGLQGTVQIAISGEADIRPARTPDGPLDFRPTAITADINGRGLRASEQALGDAHLTAASQGNMVHVHLESNTVNSEVRGEGDFRLEGDYPGSANVTFAKLDMAQLRAWLKPSAPGEPSPFTGSAEGQLHVEGPLLQPEALKAELRIPKFDFGPASTAGLPTGRLVLHNSGPIVASMTNNVITIDSARFTGEATDFTLSGKISPKQANPLDLHAAGKVDLGLIHDFNEDFASDGTVNVDATVRGTFDTPLINGRTDFQNASFNIEGVPNGISDARGVVTFTGDPQNGTRATIQSFSGETGGGRIELTGFAGLNGSQALFRIHAVANQVRIRYPEGVSTVVNANLNLTGTTERSNLEGSISIVRTGFNPQSDFSSLLGKSAEPVQTPAVRTGLLGGLSFDVQINTAPDVQFQSSLTQDMQMEARLRLTGSFSNPAVLGRVNIVQGQLIFFGTKYTVNQGTVQFFNPLRIDPILDVDLETKANGIDVTLNISGPATQPKLTPRSDPPLQFNEIVALLTTGRSPTSDPTRLTQESTAPQSWLQMGASALLGQALASPVAGRLQRFFGVSQLRIDPTITGVENNPQARLTIEQQVTSDITFTYITNVTNSNPQVVRVEWSFAKQWSVVALREENGLFGLDFFFKKRF